MLSFTFGNKNSYTDFGILIAKRPNIPLPKRRVANVIIPGRNSSLKFDEGTYDDITITLECSIIDKKDIIEKIDKIKEWLVVTGESDLIFSFEPNKKYIAQVVNAIDFKQALKYTSSFPLIFNCKPFKYSVEKNIITVTKNNSTIYNEGTFQSEPVIKVYGNGDIKLKINNDEVIIKNVDGYVTVDSVLKDCYKDDVLKNGDMIGEFPVFKVGENIMGFSENVGKMEVWVNEVWI
ncbi:distal tail protein Dit [Clostridium botulinum]|uniref:distal tail protein Dit n=1 Tax=Clostridium botulinum TaxID=1491 RepID=UPI0007734AC2|nr:distal tail protein Dit [Clostridium botulinum]NFL36781.1 phage tail protein [Clostridium botulinum]NFL64539.1 phage tail protein [Clostridium botulinum]NFN06665.1 phage tail protein [Clostridium botulinum]NFN23529.1 phage tail protein [Clostridium botulinum]NFN30185.1 phage tail protein [Clostridium botulinum]